MENKYYTPTIEEFHVGFEYYFRSAWQEGVSFTEVTIDGKDGYEPMIFDFNIYHPNKGESWKDVHQSMIDHDQIKVKYLDKEDIESLGFKVDVQKDGRIIAVKPKILGVPNVEVGHWIIKYKPNTKEIQIETCSTWNERIYWIQGVKIRNKSELKVLLKQLGIDV